MGRLKAACKLQGDRSGKRNSILLPAKEYLKYLIEENKLKRRKIPSEMELCRDHGVSRTVVRQALNELVNEGLLTRSKGKGLLARPKIVGNLMQRLYGFHKDMTGQDLEVK